MIERAQCAIGWMTEMHESPGVKIRGSGLSTRMILQSSGPRYAGDETNLRLLARDRSVEIRAYWDGPPATNSKPHPPPSERAGWALNDQSLEPDVSVGLLALIVALSAYLATIGIFLRERAIKFKADIDCIQAANPAHKKLEDLRKSKLTTDIYLYLLMVADLPMIVAAFLLFLHVFYFFSPRLLNTTIRLLTLAGITSSFSMRLRMVALHLQERQD